MNTRDTSFQCLLFFLFGDGTSCNPSWTPTCSLAKVTLNSRVHQQVGLSSSYSPCHATGLGAVNAIKCWGSKCALPHLVFNTDGGEAQGFVHSKKLSYNPSPGHGHTMDIKRPPPMLCWQRTRVPQLLGTGTAPRLTSLRPLPSCWILVALNFDL